MGSFPETLIDPIEQQGISFDSNFPFVPTKEAGVHAPCSCGKYPVHGTSHYKGIFLLQSILHSLFQKLVTTKFLPVNANMSFPSGGLTSKKN